MYRKMTLRYGCLHNMQRCASLTLFPVMLNKIE